MTGSRIEVYIDGLCQPKNPNGIACWAYCIYKEGTKLTERWGVVGQGKGMSNNVAEYVALKEALKDLASRGWYKRDIIIYSDSQLLVNQMNGEWDVRRGMYVSVYLDALKLAKNFAKISFVWIPREQNTEADRLSQRAYEEYCKVKGLKVLYNYG